MILPILCTNVVDGCPSSMASLSSVLHPPSRIFSGFEQKLLQTLSQARLSFFAMLSPPISPSSIDSIFMCIGNRCIFIIFTHSFVYTWRCLWL